MNEAKAILADRDGVCAGIVAVRGRYCRIVSDRRPIGFKKRLTQSVQ